MTSAALGIVGTRQPSSSCSALAAGWLPGCPDSQQDLWLPGQAWPLHFRHATSDKYVIAEVLAKEQYACVRNITNVRVVVDAGPNIGTASRYFLDAFPNARVLALEPDCGNFSVLARNLAYYGERAVPIHAALVDTDRRMRAVQGAFRDGAEWSIQVVDGDDVEGSRTLRSSSGSAYKRLTSSKSILKGTSGSSFLTRSVMAGDGSGDSHRTARSRSANAVLAGGRGAGRDDEDDRRGDFWRRE